MQWLKKLQLAFKIEDPALQYDRLPENLKFLVSRKDISIRDGILIVNGKKTISDFSTKRDEK